MNLEILSLSKMFNFESVLESQIHLIIDRKKESYEVVKVCYSKAEAEVEIKSLQK